jgi:hypothetical protein
LSYKTTNGRFIMLRQLTSDLLDLAANEVGYRHARAAVNLEICCCSCSCCDCLFLCDWDVF